MAVSINKNFLKLPGNYLFAEIARRVDEEQKQHPDKEIIRLGIGDVTLPLAPAVVEALKEASEEMGRQETFKGYAPYEGYDFLREMIAREDYGPLGCGISAVEIFVSDGAKGDCATIQELFAPDARIAICDPVYPVYLDSNVMAGRTGMYREDAGMFDGVIYMPCTRENGFVPELPEEQPDLIYLCFPNNPTGEAISLEALQRWVDYANRTGAVILYDAAYEAYISRPEIPHSIYQCQGAKTCAIEIRSFSKKAGFTGVRLGFMVIPKELKRDGIAIKDLWLRRQGSKYNGVPYIIQRAGMAVYTEEGKQQIREQIAYYMANAAEIYHGLKAAGYEVYGGVDSPYVWMKTPGGTGSWDFFDRLLKEAGVVGTPGSGFGPSGEGYFRLTAFGSKENTQKAIDKIKNM